MSEEAGQDRGFIANLIHNNMDTVRDIIMDQMQDRDFIRTFLSSAIRNNMDTVRDVIVQEVRDPEFIKDLIREHPDLVRGVVVDLLAGRVKESFADDQQREQFRTRWIQPLIAVLNDMDKELAE